MFQKGGSFDPYDPPLDPPLSMTYAAIQITIVQNLMILTLDQKWLAGHK